MITVFTYVTALACPIYEEKQDYFAPHNCLYFVAIAYAAVSLLLPLHLPVELRI
jgi:hypothetical protein